MIFPMSDDDQRHKAGEQRSKRLAPQSRRVSSFVKRLVPVKSCHVDFGQHKKNHNDKNLDMEQGAEVEHLHSSATTTPEPSDSTCPISVFAIAPIASRMVPASEGAAGGAAVVSQDDCGGGIGGARGGARVVPGGEGCGEDAVEDGGGAPVAGARAGGNGGKAAKEMV